MSKAATLTATLIVSLVFEIDSQPHVHFKACRAEPFCTARPVMSPREEPQNEDRTV